MSVAMGMILAYGLCSLFGLFYSAAHTVIPFLLLGIGIDNIFVITQVFKMYYLFLTLSYLSKNKWIFLSSEGFSALENKHSDMFSEVNVAIQSGVTALWRQ